MRVDVKQLIDQYGNQYELEKSEIDLSILNAVDWVVPPSNVRRGKDASDYILNGLRQVKRSVKYLGLSSEMNILDVGCGDGRFASCLMHFLRGGAYATFEVQERFVTFLNENIAKKFRNFSFAHADIWHSYYNKNGKYKPSEYSFPFGNATFDVVTANSIFTHFLPEDIRHYLREIKRVLKKGGCCLATFFIADENAIMMDKAGETNRVLTQGKRTLLNYHYNNYWVRDEDVKEKVVIFDDNWIKRVYRECGFTIVRSTVGEWGGSVNKLYFNPDFIVAMK